MVFLSQVTSREEFTTGLVVTAADIARPRIGSFLHRNFITAIKYQVHRKMKGSRDSSDERSSVRPRYRPEQRTTLRRIEENAMLRKDWEFSLKPKQIRKRNDTLAPKKPDSVEERPSKRIRLDNIPCHCDVTLFGNGNRILARRSTNGHVTMINIDRESPVLDISMGSVTFGSSDLEVSVKETQSSTKMRIIDSYFLQISIFPEQNDHPSWPPMPINRPSSSYTSGPSIIQLLSKWVSLPRLPSEDNLLPIEILIKPIDGLAQRAPLSTKYGLQVEARWMNPSPLETQIRSIRDASIRSLPSPGTDSESNTCQFKGERKVYITYLFRTSASTTSEWQMRGFKCPFCKEDQQEWNVLRVHFLHFHDNFDFDIEHSNGTGDDDVKTVKVGIVDGYREKTSEQVKDPQTFTWQTPWEPFDMDTDPGGQNWKVKPITAKTSLDSSKPRPGARKQALPLNHSSSSTKTPQLPKARSKIPEPARQLSSSRRKKYLVPAAPGNLSFFRSRGKRPLKEGELLTESDDDVDINWLDQKHSKTLDALSELTLSEKNFMKVYDSYMLAQRLASSRYLPDAILRFAKEKTEWLQNPEMESEFFRLVNKLHIDGILEDACRANCWRLINEKALQSTADNLVPMDVDGPHQNPATTIISGDLSTNCTMCHQNIAVRKQGIVCANKNCTAFVHLKCVGLERKQPRWICDDCSLDGGP